jgi:hypothetical protein
LAEIEALGIDVEAPENQFVYNFDVTLVFQETPLAPVQITANGMGDIIYVTGGGSTAVATPTVVPAPGHPEVPPTVAFLKISNTASFLKEFFEVSVRIFAWFTRKLPSS